MKNSLFYLVILVNLFSCGNPKGQNASNGAVKITETSLIVRTSKTWEENRTLIITFIDGEPETKMEVERFSNEWTKYANINFAFYPTPNDVPKNKTIDILISFKKTGNNSSVGRDSLASSKNNTYSMSLSELDKKFIHLRRSTILHEFGHALGLEHEHQHINRNFKLNEEKALEYCRTVYGFDESTCRLNIIQTISGNDVYMSKYDPLSIMHYSLHPSFLQNQINLSNNISLSLLDKIEIAKVYPGRMSEEEIIAGHNLMMKVVQDTKTYKNCKIEESFLEKIRLNEKAEAVLVKVKQYSFSSIRSGELSAANLWEDKEGMLVLLKSDDYCNYDTNSLEAFRANLLNENLKNQSFGNCIIPLNENGSPKDGLCSSEYPFQIFEQKSQKSTDNSCYGSFKQALASMKNNKYCILSPQDLLEEENKRIAEFEVSRKFGSCVVEKRINGCSPATPWYITKEDKKSLNSFCYSEPTSAIKDMRKDIRCQ
ncbi:MAG: hypothetical protein H7281_07860 [Bacteriovorax sp.]|nr:hypothetical protein [Bacteriovorax sp.]